MQNTKKKPTKIWIVLIAAPIPLLVLVSILQFAIRAALGQASGDASGTALVRLFLNVTSLGIGITSVFCLFLLPLWIVLLVMAFKHNKAVDAQAASAAQPPVAQPTPQAPQTQAAQPTPSQIAPAPPSTTQQPPTQNQQ